MKVSYTRLHGDKWMIRKEIKMQDIQKAITEDGWRFGNKILYDMCYNNPEHTNKEVVIGKIWLIGRSYAAAIE